MNRREPAARTSTVGVNFNRSGALVLPRQLAADGKTLLKYIEGSTLDRKPAGPGWSLHVFKDDQSVEMIPFAPAQSLFRIGRSSDVNCVVTAHASCSSQHAVIQFQSPKDRSSDVKSQAT
jgi:hypothetical protein